MKKTIFLLLLIFGYNCQSQDLLLQNARILDFSKSRFTSPTQLLIRNGKIDAIGRKVKLPAAGKTLDLNGAYVLPGLIDAHVHKSEEY